MKTEFAETQMCHQALIGWYASRDNNLESKQNGRVAGGLAPVTASRHNHIDIIYTKSIYR